MVTDYLEGTHILLIRFVKEDEIRNKMFTYEWFHHKN